MKGTEMKYIEFPANARRWDAYREFYADADTGFMQFEDGSAVCTLLNPNPDYRGVCGKMGVSIVATRDSHMPTKLLTVSGEKVPQAWLDYKGMQYFAQDLTLGVMVRIGNRTVAEELQIPANKRRGSVYWPAYDCKPVGGAVQVYRPVSLTANEKLYMAEMKKMANALCALNDIRYAPSTPSTLGVANMRSIISSGQLPADVVGSWDVKPDRINRATGNIEFVRTLSFKSGDFLERSAESHAYLTWEGVEEMVTQYAEEDKKRRGY